MYLYLEVTVHFCLPRVFQVLDSAAVIPLQKSVKWWILEDPHICLSSVQVGKGSSIYLTKGMDVKEGVIHILTDSSKTL